jgi:hypothetical protein
MDKVEVINSKKDSEYSPMKLFEVRSVGLVVSCLNIPINENIIISLNKNDSLFPNHFLYVGDIKIEDKLLGRLVLGDITDTVEYALWSFEIQIRQNTQYMFNRLPRFKVKENKEKVDIIFNENGLNIDGIPLGFEIENFKSFSEIRANFIIKNKLNESSD